MKALYKAMIFLVDYVEELTPDPRGSNYHAARRLVNELKEELRDLENLEKEFEPEKTRKGS